MLRRALLVVACGALAAGSAMAGPTDPAGGSPRAIGRAGVSAVSDDGAGALQINPAGIARRESWRIQLGIGFLDDATAWTAKNAPVSRDQAGTTLAPTIGVVGAFGSWIVGAGVMTSGAMERAFRDPADVPTASIHPVLGRRVFEYRYAGIAAGYRRDTLVLGVARRVTDTVAVGLSTGLSRIGAYETRRMWVGFENAVQMGLDNPVRDLQVALDGATIVPHATLGTLVAPEDTPLELGLSIGWVKRPRIEGSISGATFGPEEDAPVFRATSPTASLILRQPIAIHAGARYVGERFTVEIGGDLWLASQKARKVAWELTGVRVANSPQQGSIETELDGVPSRYSLRSHGAIRVAGDVEIISGFLWGTAGYAYTVGGTTESRLSPTFGDLGGHTIALGIEGTKGGVTYTIGWSRTVSKVRSRESELRLDNPFGAGDTFVPDGSYDASADQVGVLLDLELDAP
ncbi:MAG: hypothetical protein AB7L94_20865 [Kofleriaceae bacterium]